MQGPGKGPGPSKVVKEWALNLGTIRDYKRKASHHKGFDGESEVAFQVHQGDQAGSGLTGSWGKQRPNYRSCCWVGGEEGRVGHTWRLREMLA